MSTFKTVLVAIVSSFSAFACGESDGMNEEITSQSVECHGCEVNWSSAKADGLNRAVARLEGLIGIPADGREIVYHLSADETCPAPWEGTVPDPVIGYMIPSDEQIDLCLFEVERPVEQCYAPGNTLEEVAAPQNQVVPLYWTMKVWELGRLDCETIMSPLRRAVVYIATENVGDVCDTAQWPRDGHDYDRMAVGKLCDGGLNNDSVVEILRDIANAADEKGSELSVAEAKEILGCHVDSKAIGNWLDAVGL